MTEERTEPGFKDYLGSYNGLNQLGEETLAKPYDASLRSTTAKVLGLDEKTFWNVTPDSIHREISIAKEQTGSKLVEQIDANLEEILNTETAGLDMGKTSNLLLYTAQNSKPVVGDPENPTSTEIFHSQLYNAAKIAEARKENPEEAKEMMKESLRYINGEMIDRLTINQSQVLDTLYGSFVETATEQYLQTFMKKGAKTPEFKMGVVKGYLAKTMQGSDAETKIKLANGLVSIN